MKTTKKAKIIGRGEPSIKHFTILAIQEGKESPMVGTIAVVENNKTGAKSFEERLAEALNEHFDCENMHLISVPNLFEHKPFWDARVMVDDSEHEIRIMETWLY